jgi:hypothetical protein
MSTSMVIKGGPWLVAACVIALLAISIGAETARGPDAAEKVAIEGSPFGVFYGLTPARGRPTPQYLKELGAHWTRQTLDWQVVQPKRGVFKWGLVDATVQLVDASERAGFPINILVTIRARAPWATRAGRGPRGQQATSPPADLQDYYQFVNAAVKRARGRVHYWQIENEVQYQVFWQGTPEQYLELLRTGYRAVKDADPSAQVVLAGIGDVAWLTPMLRDEVLVGKGDQALTQYNEWATGNNSPQAKQRPANSQQLLTGVRRYDKMSNFTHRLLQADAARFFDVVDLHAYHPYTLIPAGVRWAQAVMAKQGYSKPIWITETSGPNYPEMWPSEKEGERRETEEVVKRYVLAIAAGAQRVFWYVLQTPPHQAQGKWSHTGLLRPDGSKRPAYSTLGLMIGKLDGAREVRTLNAGAGAQVFEFVRPEGSVYVLWADGGATTRIPTGPGQVEITDALGNRTTRDSQGNELELTVSSLPVFVRLASAGAGRTSRDPASVSPKPGRRPRSTASTGCGTPKSSARSLASAPSTTIAANR